ncbi:Alpha-L-Rha alpha-1,3-L-rhamnosyltransferase [hydrothermal vent metagenome]|uniref:Alpha-L-Rha alpha-1,3-L-rhamnosyltransferase n=1 Tax=hydrothermal vent metagenome TaxID=652676 RepID=A0A3B0W1Q6_9ZZZZ
MTQLPTVAVLLAAYNGREFIAEQVDSIFNQTGIDIQLFISVDLSTDSTFEWCKKLENKNDNVTILEYGERFGGAAKNFFRLICDVNFSAFDYVAFSDQDDIWLHNKLSHAIEVIQVKKLDVFSSDVLAFWEDGRKKLVKKSYPQKPFDYYFEAAGPGCTYVFKRDAIQSFKGFLGSNFTAINQVALHDWMIYAFCRFQGMRWYIDDIPLMYYRQHEFNQVGSNSGLRAYLKRISMVKEKWYRSEVEKVMVLVAPDGYSERFLNRVFLIKHFWLLRRRPRDCWALLLMLIVGVF